MEQVTRPTETTKDLTLTQPEHGLIPINKILFTPQQRSFIKEELIKMLACRNEPLTAVHDIWIDCFEEMPQVKFNELIMRIRVARITKRYGTVTGLGDIFGDDEYWIKYRDYFKKVGE